jgi:autoinducer 2-degrading protein
VEIKHHCRGARVLVRVVRPRQGPCAIGRAVKENGAASVKEPGCREFNISVSEKDPNHVFLFEVYDNAAALEAHRATDHFKKYAATVKEMVAKREIRVFSSVAFNSKGK